MGGIYWVVSEQVFTEVDVLIAAKKLECAGASVTLTMARL